MEQEEPVFQGSLLLPPVGKLLLKKSWQQKHCLLFKASKFGIERLEIFDAVDSKESKIITLENCIKVHAKSPTTFSITTKSAVHEFGTLCEQNLKEWLNAIQSVAFPDEVSGITSIEEDNDLYCSSGGEGVFTVKLHNSAASERCGLENKNYTLVLTSVALQLRNIPDNKLLYTWPYCYIRRYGYKSEKFTFEAGRMCKSGEGKFFLEYSNRLEILRCLESKMQALKKLQGYTALTMKPRSRTPFPPSSTSESLEDLNLSQLNMMNLDHSISQSSHKVKPVKPPRKALPIQKTAYSNNTTLTSDDDYETVGKYDDIEYRSDAWRTLGIEEPNHTEQVTEDDDDEEVQYTSWGTREKKDSLSTKPSIQPTAAKIISHSSVADSDDYYDKLNFFGSSSKLNVKSGYKQVYPIPIAPVPPSPSFNEYDEIQCNLDMESVRPADDSHLGYALIRKEPGKDFLKQTVKESDNKNKKEKDPVNHQFHNEEPYALISKPKRV